MSDRKKIAETSVKTDGETALQLMESLLLARSGRGHPPVETWHPPAREDIGLAIDGAGVWHYQGTPIARPAMVRLFASVLRRDDDGFWLVTPVERVPIRVADAPFLAVEMTTRGKGAGQDLLFRTNVDDVVIAGGDHPIRFEGNPAQDGLKPFVTVRGNLEARVVRSVYYDLVNICEVAETERGRQLGVWSNGVFFAMAPGDLFEDGGA